MSLLQEITVPVLQLGAECRWGRLEARPHIEADSRDLCPRLSTEFVGPLGQNLERFELPVHAEHGAEAGLHDALLRLQLHDSTLLVLREKKSVLSQKSYEYSKKRL